MSSSIEEEFQPPEWATKEEVIKAAQHYINYWKIEARSRNQQWLDALQGESNAKRCETSLRGELNRKHQEFAILQSARERDVAENASLKAEVERLTALVESNLNSSKVAMGKADAVLHERDNLKAEVERLKEGNDCLGQMHDKEMERSAYLLEEFNRTTAWGRGLESDLSHARVEISFLKAEVERLRASSFVTAVPVEQYERLLKAGDAMASSLGNGGVIVSGYILADEWLKAKYLAAKEGKPSDE